MTSNSTKKEFYSRTFIRNALTLRENSQWSNKCTKLSRIFNADKNVLSGYITLKDNLQHSCSIRNRQKKKSKTNTKFGPIILIFVGFFYTGTSFNLTTYLSVNIFLLKIKVQLYFYTFIQ